MPDLYELVAVCDPTDFNARAVAGRFTGQVYTDVNDLLARERLDTVVIVTPPESHHVMAGATAQHGVHMLIETPLAPTRAMMDTIGDVAARAGVKVEVGENYWRRPVEQLNRQALDAGLIGDVLRVTCFYEMGGPAEMSYHAMSLMRFYAGAGSAGAEVRAFEQRRQVKLDLDDSGRPFNPEVWSLSLVSFSNGVCASNTQISTWSSPLRRSHPRAVTIEGTAGTIVGGRGTPDALYRLGNGKEVGYPLIVDAADGAEGSRRYHYDTNSPVEIVFPYAEWPLPSSASTFGIEDDVARARELLSLYRAVTTGAEPEYGIADARQDQELSIAVNEAARINDVVHLPLGGETAWEREQHEAFWRRWECEPFADASTFARQNFGARARA